MKRILLIYLFTSVFLFTGKGYALTLFPDADTANHHDGTAHYLNLGGHLFAGAYPINNPVNTGDTGVVFLYRINNNHVIPIDTTLITTYGYYTFSQVIQGEYLLKGGLTRNSQHYKEYFPTYFTSSIKWTVSDHLVLNDTDRYEANIHLIPTTDVLSGPCSMSGYVMQTLKGQGFEKLANIEIIVYDAQMTPLIYSFSDLSGDFLFTDLPYGTYYLMVESTGKFPALLKVTLDENHPVLNNLILEVFNHAPTFVNENEGHARIESSQVFPNPATDKINLILRSSEPELIQVEIFSITGLKIFSETFQVSGLRTLSIPVTPFSNDLYFLNLRSEDGKWSQTQKFLKF
jgi:hypothetical protein